LTENDDAGDDDAAARLESALERIAQLGRRPSPEVAKPGESVDTSAIAVRLDALIAQLRGALET
jgi:hypothetical protein